MNRRSFIKLGAMASAALGFASRVAPEAMPAAQGIPEKLKLLGTAIGVSAMREQTFGRPISTDTIVYIDSRGDYQPMRRDYPFGDDAKMYRAFAQLEFEQAKMWPSHSRVINLGTPGDIDAL